MAFHSAENPNFENFKTLNLGVLEQNDIYVTSVINHRKYYKGEGGGFLKFEQW